MFNNNYWGVCSDSEAAAQSERAGYLISERMPASVILVGCTGDGLPADARPSPSAQLSPADRVPVEGHGLQRDSLLRII